MNFSKLSIIASFLFISILTACGGGSNTNAPTNAVNSNIPANANKPANGGLTTTTPPKEETVNQADTITPVYKAYCAAMEKKDEAAIRKIYSQETLKSFEADMKADGIKTLVEFLSTDKVTTKLCEVRNEQIQGDTAIAEIRAEGYPNGIKVKFIKEGNEWKMTNQSPAFDDVKKTGNNPAK